MTKNIDDKDLAGVDGAGGGVDIEQNQSLQGGSPSPGKPVPEDEIPNPILDKPVDGEATPGPGVGMNQND